MIKITYIFILLSLSLAAFAVEFSVPIFPRSEIESQNIVENKEHVFLLSTPKRISNALHIEKEKRIKGNRINILIRVDDASSSEKAFRFYQNYFSDNGQVLYQCDQRACGSSIYWSNTIFNERKLYGRDSNQHYIVGTIQVGNVEYWMSVYSVTNGRKKHYVYLSYVSTNALDQTVSSSTVWQTGRSFEQAKLNEQEVASLVENMASSSDSVLWIAAFSIGEGTVSPMRLIDSSRVAAEQFKTYLISTLPIDSEKVKIKAIGPFGRRPAGLSSNKWFTLYVLPL